MTEQQIVDSWFEYRTNRIDLPTIAYTEPIYDFIRATANMRQYGDDVYYNVFGVWQKIIVKP